MSNGTFPPQLYQPEELLDLEGLEPQQSHGVRKPSSELVLLVRPEPSQHYALFHVAQCKGTGWGKTGLYLLRIHSGLMEVHTIHLVLVTFCISS